jgi:hypothetical protein
MPRADHELPFGVAANGRLVAVDTVLRGLACNCTCPQCGRPLVARQGDQLAHHFAHGSGAACQGAYESMVHRLAKQVIADEAELRVPALIATHMGATETVIPSRRLQVMDVRLEVWQQGFRPDVIAHFGDRELAIEIYYTHRCPPAKVALIRARGLPTFEIDLSAIDATADDFHHQVTMRATRRWLFNPRQEEADADLTARISAAAERRRLADEERRLDALHAEQRARLIRDGKLPWSVLDLPWRAEDIDISSRYDVPHELTVMSGLAAAVDPELRRYVSSIWCDSKAGSSYSAALWTESAGIAEQIAEAFHQQLLARKGGYNSLELASISGRTLVCESGVWPY